MHSWIPIILSTIALLSGTGSAHGINCDGSSLCNNEGLNADLTGIKGAVAQLIMDGHSKRHYAQGQQLACSNNICAFYQNLPGGENVEVAYKKLADLQKHGCKRCGSCPTKDGNDVSTGMITVNYVTNACCTGASCYCL